jgi:hypothetical protein
VNPIRPPSAPTVPTARPANDARAAFFQAVKGAPAAAPTTAPTQPQTRQTLPTPTVTPVRAQADPGQPQRYLRPGSIVDIKV